MSKHVHDENCNHDHDHDNSIVLVDDSGEEMKFEIIITLEHEGKEYALLKKPEDDSDDMFAFRIEEDEDGELLIPVEEDKEIEMIQKIYNELADEDEE
ncbi:DUF1292 domain-containing protein [Alkalibacter saccharofermentans]|uniref:UPF0473 protein SAMN02746064_00139 n=1 Tax=Alkalibacter saccharofermentans DSM 14828 TaxID=1120975 RepID=A0A1M4S7T0_9FIRM|nr:DUF1292 domain-containing protein [Alkalibacter saccharofermentans]SHE28238.1 Protein of unknown function [Alkalibacter saccharofermentans DSM 14828]